MPVHPLKHTGGVEMQIQSFLVSALDGGEWSASCSGHLTLGKESWYPLIHSQSGICGEQKKICCPERPRLLNL